MFPWILVIYLFGQPVLSLGPFEDLDACRSRGTLVATVELSKTLADFEVVCHDRRREQAGWAV